MTDRKSLLLDSAIDLLADGGARRLTHRAVDAGAGVPVGSTSNLFRTRDALLAGVLQRLLERENEVWTRLPLDPGNRSIDAFADWLGALVETLGDSERRLTAARHAVFAEAALEPRLRESVIESRRRLAAWMGPMLAELGSRHPERDLRALLALLDGLLSSQLVDPDPAFTPAPAIAALLHGLID